MPAEGIHLTALREAMAAPTLDAPVRRLLVRRDDAARLGALVPDLPYFHRYALEVVRYLTGLPAQASPWGAAIHDGGAVVLLGSLLAVARRERDPVLGAIALGVASHCAIDRALHPLVNALARQHRGALSHDAAHREVEKFQSICFHEQYLGRDTMGTSGITAYLTIHTAETWRASDRTSALLCEAWAGALSDAPGARALAGLVRGYRQHARLLGTPLGKRVAPPAAKDAARPKFLRGAWGTFEALLEDAIAASIPVVNAAGAVLEAGDSGTDAATARARLAALLPDGTIDPQGDALDLARPVAISLRALSI
ncbi:MAG TPA: zinc dependent phospholipase C family protein [Kofleriaceae bacterium]|nr:zinc dependent phospholipase C family protein [Kofleriaceae bacterium]